MINGLDLFSGIGGITCALYGYVRPVAYCEIDRYSQGVLLSRMATLELPLAPIWDDVRTLRGAGLPEIDIIYGGFPCQDISIAGNGVGLGGERSGLFFHIARLIKETNPRFVFLENVPAIRTRGLNSVIQTFAELGYDCRWTVVSAKEVGACHLRKRWFLLAHAMRDRGRLQSGRREWQIGAKKKNESSNESPSRNVADANGSRLERPDRCKQSFTKPCGYGEQLSEPSICRGVNGLSNRVDRIKGLGNAVVPAQARKAFMKLIGLC